MPSFDGLPVAYLVGLGLAAASTAYLVLALWRVAQRPAIGDVSVPYRPPVTVLKPLCGDEPGLHECLRSFCRQDYGELQVIFGVADPSDSAVPIARRLIAEFPDRDLSLVADARMHGTNLKVSNLVNMCAGAKHDIIVVSDSDTLARPDCIARVVAPLAERDVGAVTCLYRGAPRGGIASTLGALFINDWFLPSAVVDAAMRDVAYCFGPVTAIRRDALERIGGFRRLVFNLADDFLLGRLIAAAGYRVRLSSHVVDTVVAEDFRSLFRHELRWARTVRTVKPREHVLAGVMQPLPLLMALLLPYPELGGWALAGLTVLLRMALHHLTRWRFEIGGPAYPWLLPLRECLCFAVWAASFCGSNVRWRQRDFSIGRGGSLIPRPLPAPETGTVT